MGDLLPWFPGAPIRVHDIPVSLADLGEMSRAYDATRNQAYSVAQQQYLAHQQAVFGSSVVCMPAAADLMNIAAPKLVEPLDPTSDSTFDAWMHANDGRTIEEFACDGGRPIAR